MVKVAVITGSTGHHLLSEAARSVQHQTWASEIEHWIVVDGAEHEYATRSLLGKLPISNVVQHVLVLPKNTGASGYVCHRINGSVPWLVDADYVCFLDQDNAFEPDHIQRLIESIPNGGRWAHSFRKIIDRDGRDICLDACESLGGVCHTCINAHDRLIDTNCYDLPCVGQCVRAFVPSLPYDANSLHPASSQRLFVTSIYPSSFPCFEHRVGFPPSGPCFACFVIPSDLHFTQYTGISHISKYVNYVILTRP